MKGAFQLIDEAPQRRLRRRSIQLYWRDGDEINRLCANKTEVACVQYIIGHRGKGGDSDPIDTNALNAWSHTESLRATQEGLQRLCDEKILIRRVPAKRELPRGVTSIRGWYVYSVPTGTWKSLPSYVPAKKPIEVADELHAAENTDDAETQAGLGKQKLRLAALDNKPLALTAGQPSKAYDVAAAVDGKVRPLPVGKIQFDTNVPNLQVDPVFRRGLMRISIRMGSAGRDLGEAKANGSTRHGALKSLTPAVSTAADAASARAAPVEAAISAREMARAFDGTVALKRDVLNRWFGKTLGPVDDETVTRIVIAQGTAADADVMHALKRRSRDIQSWGLVVEIHRSLGRAAAKVGDLHEKTPADHAARQNVGETPADLAAWERRQKIETLQSALMYAGKDEICRQVLDSADPELLAEAKAT
jgi:hypothetical protein